jgi:hypothetical protein
MLGLEDRQKHCPCSTLLSNLVCIISSRVRYIKEFEFLSRGIDTNEGTLDILKMVAQYGVFCIPLAV